MTLTPAYSGEPPMWSPTWPSTCSSVAVALAVSASPRGMEALYSLPSPSSAVSKVLEPCLRERMPRSAQGTHKGTLLAVYACKAHLCPSGLVSLWGNHCPGTGPMWHLGYYSLPYPDTHLLTRLRKEKQLGGLHNDCLGKDMNQGPQIHR